MGMLLSRRRQGRCRALEWHGAEQRYVCGVLARPGHWLPWLPAALGRQLAARWISAAQGCDAEIEPA